MKIEDLKDKQGKVDIDVKIIWDQLAPKPLPDGKLCQTVLVANADSEKGDGSPTAYLDIYANDIGKFKQFDKVRITNSFIKQKKNGQFWITCAHKIEKI